MRLINGDCLIEMQKLEREAQLKKELMQIEFEMNMQLKQAETNVLNYFNNSVGVAEHPNIIESIDLLIIP